jgi:type VI secretion system secreted protein VgrG
MAAAGPVTITTPLAPDALVFRSMDGRESLSEPFEYSVDLVGSTGDIKLTDLLGLTVCVRIELSGQAFRYFHGYVTAFELVDSSHGGYAYRATIHPWLWLLTQTTDCRIFQNKSIPDIVKQVFGDRGFADFEDSLTEDYPLLDYVVQYRETDFNFVTRLLEEAGIYYFFKHSADTHTLVLADAYSAHEAVSGYEKLPYYPPDAHREALEDSVDRWGLRQRITPGSSALRDFDFERPLVDLTAVVSSPGSYARSDFPLYDYPGDYRQRADGEKLARIRLEQRKEGFERAEGRTNARGMTTGALFSLTEHPRADQNREYLVTDTHASVSGHELQTDGTNDRVFSCDFLTIPSSVPFRPALASKKPVVEGPQTATVVGPAGEEIWTDQYGRVKLQFHWDREGKSDENSSCWVRVSQAWAGTGWGGIHIPRIGQEVIVEFLEGDPDRPIVTGRVYNAANMPPYDLPKNMTQSGVKSRSTKGGKVPNANEIRFEDRKGGEELYVQAERNQTTLVKASQSISVGATRTTTVAKKDTVVLQDEHEITVTKKVTQTYQDDQSLTLTGNQTLDIGKDKTEHVAQTYDLTTDTEFKLTQGGTTLTFQSNQVALDAASSITVTRGPAKLTIDDSGQVTLSTPTGITLQCGPNTITMSPSGIEIKGPQIALKADPSSLELGPASAHLSGVMTTVEATAICSVKGTAMLNLNSG